MNIELEYAMRMPKAVVLAAALIAGAILIAAVLGNAMVFTPVSRDVAACLLSRGTQIASDEGARLMLEACQAVR